MVVGWLVHLPGRGCRREGAAGAGADSPACLVRHQPAQGRLRGIPLLCQGPKVCQATGGGGSETGGTEEGPTAVAGATRHPAVCYVVVQTTKLPSERKPKENRPRFSEPS